MSNLPRGPLAVRAAATSDRRSAPRPSAAASAAPRRGFTLVELLVVTLIILILAGILLAGLSGALHEAKVQRTQAQITRLHSLVMAKWESYRTRRVPLPVSGPDLVSRQMRVDALREILRMELPDRRTDVLDGPAVPGLVSTALHRAYQRRIAALAATTGKTWSIQHQSSECLYLILSQPSDDGSIPLEFFAEKEIADTDDDGVPEILDGWGNPILFLRWAPGFTSPLQTRNVALGTDTFDPTHARDGSPPTHYMLFPLIYSAGPDGIFDLMSDVSGTPLRYSQTTPRNDPYTALAGGLIGTPQDNNSDGRDDSVDNIHNHLLDAGR